jgi:hypothetical protein
MLCYSTFLVRPSHNLFDERFDATLKLNITTVSCNHAIELSMLPSGRNMVFPSTFTLVTMKEHGNIAPLILLTNHEAPTSLSFGANLCVSTVVDL